MGRLSLQPTLVVARHASCVARDDMAKGELHRGRHGHRGSRLRYWHANRVAAAAPVGAFVAAAGL